jgi:integrase
MKRAIAGSEAVLLPPTGGACGGRRWRRVRVPSHSRRRHFQSVVKAWRLIATHRLPKITPHTLRHSFASTAEDLGLTLPTIQALMGHSSVGDATSRYIHKLDASLAAAATRVPEAITMQMDGSQTEDRVVALPTRKIG